MDGNIIRDYLRTLGCMVVLAIIAAAAIGFTLGTFLL